MGRTHPPVRACHNRRESAILHGMRPRPLVIACLLCVPIAGCVSGTNPAPSAAPAPNEPAGVGQASGTFSAPPGLAVTYDQALVPVGATAAVNTTEDDGKTSVSLDVTGLQPNRRYGVHAHTMACGATGADAGPHFQLRPDPVTPSVDPAYANPQNEIWLDLTTDAQGAGESTSTVDWEIPADRRPASVVIHSLPTSTEPGKAGMAGDRAACITVPF
ncbi:hypothetical protein GCM10009610_44900 [Pseudonocardia xinjiangensis]